MRTVEKEVDLETTWVAHMTISFSYAYLKGFERLMVSSPCVHINVHLPRRAISPRMTMSNP